jgi:hypothetical protein
MPVPKLELVKAEYGVVNLVDTERGILKGEV